MSTAAPPGLNNHFVSSIFCPAIHRRVIIAALFGQLSRNRIIRSPEVSNNMRRPQITAVLLLGAFLSGCSEESSVICFAPVKPFEPQSGTELLEEFNSQLPFRVSPRHFVCKCRNDCLVGWAVVRTIGQKDIVKQKLGQSSTLTCLQVEALTPEFKAVVERQWRHSQTVTPAKKKLSSDSARGWPGSAPS
jgi:hypothetical protein